MKKNKSRIKTVLCCVIAALLIPIMFICSALIDNEFTSYIKNTLGEISTRNVNFIRSQVEDDLRLLGEISDRVRFDDSFESVMNGMKTASETYDFKRMGIVTQDGIAHSSDGAVLGDISSENHIARSFEGKDMISDIFPDNADGKTIFVCSVPVWDKAGENVTGVLYATCDTENMKSHLSASAFDGRGYSYIVKTDGTVVIDSQNAYAFPGMENVFDSMISVGKNAETADKMREEMSKSIENCLPFRRGGELRYINYEPLGINDWYLLTVVPAAVSDSSRFKIMLVVYSVFALMFVVAVVFVAVMIKNEKQKKSELERVLYVDELTGGMSFTKFCIDAQELLDKRNDRSEKVACVMMDLDNFRLINNLYGKAEGDKTILNSYRTFLGIIGENDLLTRRIADRFYALLFFDTKEELDEKLEKFVSDLKTSPDISENEYIINPSIGVYIPEKAGEDIETITNNATIAHDTLESRGARIAFYDEAQRDRLQTNKLLEDKMELAHKNHEFIPYFQPKYDAVTGKICGAEALIRWKNPDGSVTPPGKFIPLAESNGFIRVLDKDIFEAVCAFQKSIIEEGSPCVPISVNVSRQLMYEQNFAADYIAAVNKYGLSPQLIELEITESVLFDDYSVFRNIINTLRENGFKILMDDFGTGYSSLMMLSSVPIDNLKLDKSFIDSFEEDKGRKIIVCVIELAKSLSLPLTAEGVETREQFDFLKSMGCEVIQGYYFSKPVPEDTFRKMLASQKG